MSSKVLRSVYFSYFHSVMWYGIIFWGSSNISNNVFKMQKRAIRIISNRDKWDSCRQLYSQLQILTLPAQYIFSLVMFVIKRNEVFKPNSQIHDLNTCSKYMPHFPTTSLTLLQKGVLYSGIKIFNHLPVHIRASSNNVKQFKRKLKNLLLEQSLYSIDEFYQRTFIWKFFFLDYISQLCDIYILVIAL
jgi:hypothetical protein